MNQTISVIVPVFNNEKHIAGCLRSICENTYKKIEIIVIDDGSTDGSGKICDDYARKDPRIKVIHQKNQGVSKSRNRGIRLASGEFLSFVDSDDQIPKDFYSSLVFGLLSDCSDLCICSILHVGEQKTVFELSDYSMYLDSGDIEQREFWYRLNKMFLLYGPCNKLYRAEIIIKNNIVFPADTFYGEDLLFNMEYLNYCSKIRYIRSPKYYYYKNNNHSLSYTYRPDRFFNGLRLNDCIKTFSESHHLNSEHLFQYIQRRIFDDGYNHLFDLFSNKCELNFKQKYKQIHLIMNHKEWKQSSTFVESGVYSRLYIFLIRYRLALIFFLIGELRKLFKIQEKIFKT